MCGILFLQGPEARKSLPVWLERLRHRGPDDDAVWLDEDEIDPLSWTLAR